VTAVEVTHRGLCPACAARHPLRGSPAGGNMGESR
jgi:hypothetical protein